MSKKDKLEEIISDEDVIEIKTKIIMKKDKLNKSEARKKAEEWWYGYTKDCTFKL